MTQTTGHSRTALVTGASSGIGEAFARVFASAGFNVVITARRAGALETVAAEIGRDYAVAVHVVPADLAAPGAIGRLVADVERRGLTIDALVNDAGFGTAGSFVDTDWIRQSAMLQLHVNAVAELTHRLLPGMLARGYGRIVNVASIAGLVPSGSGALYSATKAFVVSLSCELDREVRRHGVHVTAVCPGLTRTHFHDAPELRGTVAAMPRWAWMEPATVARQGFAAVMAGTPVCVNGIGNRIAVATLRYVPRPILRSAARAAARAYPLVAGALRAAGRVRPRRSRPTTS